MVRLKVLYGLALVAVVATAPVAAQAGLFDGLTGPIQKPEPPVVHEGVPQTQTENVAGLNQMPILQSNSAELLQADAEKYKQIISQGGFPQVSAFGTLKKGDKGGAVATLNKRLFLEGYLQVEGTQGQYADLFTSATQAALARFQRNHGILPTGKLDQPTVTELNIPADKRLATIEANIPRLQAYEEGLGDRYIVVNIPAQQLEAVDGGRVVERHNTIVGRPARPTPVVMTPLETVRFNPYWYAPQSIVKKDILPKINGGNLKYLSDFNIKILQGNKDGPVVDPKTLDFNHINLDNYVFREEPGPGNAMASAKIEFKSPFGIYLHDTPDKDLFNFNNRFYSSGCIRVQNVAALLNWVLNGQDGYNPDLIAAMAKNLQRVDVTLVNPAQLRVAYLTAWPQPGGTVAFRNDVYQMDGSGFVVGQPMPVGEMSPDGKRFVLKPLPTAPSVEDDSITHTTGGGGLFGQSKPGSPVQLASAGSGKSVAGFFDWPSYYKQQAEAAKNGGVDKLKKKKKKKGSADAATDKSSAKKSNDKKTASADTKPVKKKKPINCTPDDSGNLPPGC